MLLNGEYKTFEISSVFLMKKKVDPYFFHVSVMPFLSYVPLKAKFENSVCMISQEVFELEPFYLVYCWGLRSR